MDAFHITREHVYEALDAAGPGPVDEGNVGGGTGMICHDFKGGIGTASRLVEIDKETYTLGVLVQANHGSREDLRVDGVPVGRLLGADQVPLAWGHQPQPSSIIVVIATDAPLLPGQNARLARRAAVGFARAGGIGHNGSGDLFLAFATGNAIPAGRQEPFSIRYLPNYKMNPLFSAAGEAVEEAIINVLTAAETMTGIHGNTAYALPLDDLVAIMAGYGLAR
jgi:D-aminopeptidase